MPRKLSLLGSDTLARNMSCRLKDLTSLMLYVGLTLILWRCVERTQLQIYFPKGHYLVPSEECCYWCLSHSDGRIVVLPASSHYFICKQCIFILAGMPFQKAFRWRAWDATMTTTHSWRAHGRNISRLVPSLVWLCTNGTLLKSKYLKRTVQEKHPKSIWSQLAVSGLAVRFSESNSCYRVTVKVALASDASPKKGRTLNHVPVNLILSYFQLFSHKFVAESRIGNMKGHADGCPRGREDRLRRRVGSRVIHKPTRGGLFPSYFVCLGSLLRVWFWSLLKTLNRLRLWKCEYG